MKIMRWILGLVLPFILTGCLSSNQCVRCSAAKHAADVAGTYYANLPCQSCGGLVVDLLLEKNQTYSMIKSPKNSMVEYEEIGVWRQQGNKISLIPREDRQAKVIGMPIKYFLVDKNKQLQLLDNIAKAYQKPTHYTFKKK